MSQQNISIDEQLGFVKQYEGAFDAYAAYARFLETVFNKAIKELSILGIVQSRPKGVVSFANKIIQKNKYRDPLNEMTDLCGARVIVHFQSQVAKVCTFIRENFNIDEANSLDARSRLQVNEFGYRSVHYIISPKSNTLLGVEVPEQFKNLKAEVQVRTLAEHVWADISHDRIYKTCFNIPDEWKRMAARLSAILEDADHDFGRMGAEIDSLARMYELQYHAGATEGEITKLKSLLKVLGDKPQECASLLLRLSSVFHALDCYADAGQLIGDWLNTGQNVQLISEFTALQLTFEKEISTFFAERQSGRPGLKAIGYCFTALEKLGSLPEKNLREKQEEISFMHYRLGKALQQNESRSNDIHSHFTAAYNLAPGNPLYLMAMIESVVCRNNEMAGYSVNLFKAGFDKAVEKLWELIGIGIENSSALFAIARCYFLAGNDTECLNVYALAVDAFLKNEKVISLERVKAERFLMERLEFYNSGLSLQIRHYLSIALYLKDREKQPGILDDYRINKAKITGPVVVLAGGASQMEETKKTHYHEYVSEVMLGFRGTIISGGTTVGIPGLAGEIKQQMAEKDSFALIAYLPDDLPDDAVVSPGYDILCRTNESHFSAHEIFSYWTDLITGGITPGDVTLIGIDGGNIASLEYRIALSLGAKTVLVGNSGRAASALFADKHWKNHGKLISLPDDPLTAWAIVKQDADTLFADNEIETLAALGHEHYRQKRIDELKPAETDINKYKVIVRWNKLDASLQNSNRKQVAFYGHLLSRVGLQVRKAETPVLFNLKNNLETEEYELLARLEHARWNAERLLEGWRYSPVKDLALKTSPYIVTWDKLDEETRKYDYDPVNEIPAMLNLIGYEIFKPEKEI